jgi:hypothetical protein
MSFPADGSNSPEMIIAAGRGTLGNRAGPSAVPQETVGLYQLNYELPPFPVLRPRGGTTGWDFVVNVN